VVAGYLVLTEVLWPLVRPLAEALSRLHFMRSLRAWLAALGPYPALLLLAVPFLVLEPLKLLAVYWTATGHVVTGTVALLALHGASLLSTERLFAVLKPKLLTIRWFATVWGRIEAVRDAVMRWALTSGVWARLHGLFVKVRARAARAYRWIRGE
jgi:hypothetical protein